jgi:hypothetical protein
MTTATHIIGNIQSNNQLLDTLVGTLGKLGVRATHPPTGEYFYINSQHPAWHHYDTAIALYESIAESPFHIIFNDGEINEEVGRQIMYAMTKNRPILMTGAPKFAASLNPFAREMIMQHMHLFHSINLPGLEQDELKTLIGHLQSCDYHLTNSEKILINSRVKTHFRKLLEEARDIYVEKI